MMAFAVAPSVICLLLVATCTTSSPTSLDKTREHHFMLGDGHSKDIYHPTIPAWPTQFMINFDVYVKIYGEDWMSTGTLYYNWLTKTFRADYFGWCFPLFNTANPKSKDNNTCTFLATESNMYYVNHTADSWKEYECCMFQKGLAAVPPDWMKVCTYNGTDVIKGIPVDVWWLPGTNDPNTPCFVYWNAKDDINIPVQFFGISTIGPTILNYHDFKAKPVPPNIEMDIPNSGCSKECEPSFKKMFSERSQHGSIVKWWPEWPSCE